MLSRNCCRIRRKNRTMNETNEGRYVRCPLCGKKAENIRFFSDDGAAITKMKPKYIVEDKKTRAVSAYFDEAEFILKPPYSMSFTCKTCNADILIEVKKKRKQEEGQDEIDNEAQPP